MNQAVPPETHQDLEGLIQALPPHWRNWLETNRPLMARPEGGLERFAATILAGIPGLNPEDVQPQYGFRDQEGRSRRVDFALLGPDRKPRLALELEGGVQAPTTSRTTAFEDAQARQSAVTRALGCVLLAIPQHWQDDPTAVRHEVMAALQKPLLKAGGGQQAPTTPSAMTIPAPGTPTSPWRNARQTSNAPPGPQKRNQFTTGAAMQPKPQTNTAPPWHQAMTPNPTNRPYAPTQQEHTPSGWQPQTAYQQPAPRSAPFGGAGGLSAHLENAPPANFSAGPTTIQNIARTLPTLALLFGGGVALAFFNAIAAMAVGVAVVGVGALLVLQRHS
ncbi:hypothetical protein E3E12_03180 [Formicincola oecophyllae]|uniref:DUF559 domain-containing protein n=1 Tax=Formicincola oecophyllae TaxID=2558361 RepID=A0A4Y6UAA8_9PROT|nr:hypothetical protein [Formicincola oecophyllae]QDH13367.1 hypothetical protein E3E12_03180 [Formicincola oecophyllae]